MSIESETLETNDFSIPVMERRSFEFTPAPWNMRKWNGQEWPQARYSIGPGGNTPYAVAISPKYPNQDHVEADMRVASVSPEMAHVLHEIDVHLSNGGTIERRSEFHNTVRNLLEKVVGD